MNEAQVIALQAPDQILWLHMVTVLSLLVFKLAVLGVGYLIARLGYELLVKGITGEFKFHTEFKGTKADLVSVSPGVFFIFLAVVLIAIGVIKDKPFETRFTATAGRTAVHSGAEGEGGAPARIAPPPLGDRPGKERGQ